MSEIADLRDTTVPKSDQLNAEDLLAGPLTVKIESVRRGSGKEQPVAVGIDAVLDVAQQRRMAARTHFGVAEFVHGAGLDATAELRGHGLHAVADAEHRDAELEHGRRRSRRAGLRDRLGATRQDDAARTEGSHRVVTRVPRVDFAIDAELAHAARDQLRVLRAEIEDQDPVRVDVVRPGVRRLS